MKEKAEEAATAALDVLRETLAAEVAQRDRVRSLRADAKNDRSWQLTLIDAEKDLREFVARSDAAFAAWRAACEAVPS